MTLKELLEIIKNKREDTQNDINNSPYWFDEDYMHELIGKRDAYTDLIELIEDVIK